LCAFGCAEIKVIDLIYIFSEKVCIYASNLLLLPTLGRKLSLKARGEDFLIKDVFRRYSSGF
jgi:hypothetical protein